MFRIVPQLTVKDVAASVRFYEERLGFTATVLDPPEEPAFASLEREDASLFLTADKAGPPAGAWAALQALQNQQKARGEGVRLYLEVDDARELYDTLLSAGITPLREIAYNEKEDYTEFSFADPDGYEIGVYS
jgi:catechol 2,3-dioxygenase-like lactoylglutathione lyase family enzyme